MTEWGWPTCAVCNKPADHVREWVDPNRDHILFVVRCHGENELVELSRLALMDNESIKFDVAFQKPRLK